MNKKIILSFVLVCSLALAVFAQTRLRRSTQEVELEKNGSVSVTAAAGQSVVVSPQLVVGSGGTPVLKILSATASLDFTALAANSCEVLTVTVTGAADGDPVHLGVPTALADVDGATERTTLYGFVSAADTVSVRRCNHTAAGTADPAAATVRATVVKF